MAIRLFKKDGKDTVVQDPEDNQEGLLEAMRKRFLEEAEPFKQKAQDVAQNFEYGSAEELFQKLDKAALEPVRQRATEEADKAKERFSRLEPNIEALKSMRTPEGLEAALQMYEERVPETDFMSTFFPSKFEREESLLMKDVVKNIPRAAVTLLGMSPEVMRETRDAEEIMARKFGEDPIERGLTDVMLTPEQEEKLNPRELEVVKNYQERMMLSIGFAGAGIKEVGAPSKFAQQYADDISGAATSKVKGLLPGKFVEPYKGTKGQTTLKLLDELKNEVFVTKNKVMETFNRIPNVVPQEIKLVKDKMAEVSKLPDGRFSVQELSDKVEPFLVQLKVLESKSLNPEGFEEQFGVNYEHTGEGLDYTTGQAKADYPGWLKDKIDSGEAKYFELILESPYKTYLPDVEFQGRVDRHPYAKKITDHYNSHMRGFITEKDGEKAAVIIEDQNDLQQGKDYEALFSPTSKIRKRLSGTIADLNTATSQVKALNKAKNFLSIQSIQDQIKSISSGAEGRFIGTAPRADGRAEFIIKGHDTYDLEGKYVPGVVEGRYDTLAEAEKAISKYVVDADEVIATIKDLAEKSHGISPDELDLVMKQKRDPANYTTETSYDPETLDKALKKIDEKIETSETLAKTVEKTRASLKKELEETPYTSPEEEIRDRHFEDSRNLFRERSMKEAIKYFAGKDIGKIIYPKGKASSYLQGHATSLPKQANIITKDKLNPGSRFTDPTGKTSNDYLALEREGDKIISIRAMNSTDRGTKEIFMSNFARNERDKITGFLRSDWDNAEYHEVEGDKMVKNYLAYLVKQDKIPAYLRRKIIKEAELDNKYMVKEVVTKYQNKKMSEKMVDSGELYLDEDIDPDDGELKWNIMLPSRDPGITDVRLDYEFSQEDAQNTLDKFARYIDEKDFQYFPSKGKEAVGVPDYWESINYGSGDFASVEAGKSIGLTKDSTPEEVIKVAKKISPDSVFLNVGDRFIQYPKGEEKVEFDFKDFKNPFKDWNPDSLGGTKQGATTVSAHSSYRRIYEIYETERPKISTKIEGVSYDEFDDQQGFDWAELTYDTAAKKKKKVEALGLLPIIWYLKKQGEQLQSQDGQQPNMQDQMLNQFISEGM